jgi:methylglyoxal synthase
MRFLMVKLLRGKPGGGDFAMSAEISNGSIDEKITITV